MVFVFVINDVLDFVVFGQDALRRRRLLGGRMDEPGHDLRARFLWSSASLYHLDTDDFLRYVCRGQLVSLPCYSGHRILQRVRTDQRRSRRNTAEDRTLQEKDDQSLVAGWGSIR